MLSVLTHVQPSPLSTSHTRLVQLLHHVVPLSRMLSRHCHPSPWFTIQFSLGTVDSMGLGKCTMIHVGGLPARLCHTLATSWVSQARILEWVAMPSYRGSSRPRDQTPVSWVSCIGRCILYH